MSWIKMIADSEADAELKAILEQGRAPSGQIDNVMRVHSLRPRTMLGHRALYMSVLHNDSNTLPDWLLETVSSYVSILNDCDYSLANHFANARHLIGDDQRADAILQALLNDTIDTAFSGRELAMLRYARKLTLEPGKMQEGDVSALRAAGIDDGEILELNQVIGYFNYVNRLLNGLGVSTAGEKVGFYVNADDSIDNPDR